MEKGLRGGKLTECSCIISTSLTWWGSPRSLLPLCGRPGQVKGGHLLKQSFPEYLSRPLVCGETGVVRETLNLQKYDWPCRGSKA